jgi:ornithine cyclodeaminase/alanine dehydrogenase-like protein (mu-crystallin family)
MAPADYLAAVESGFRASVCGEAFSPTPMHLPAQAGAFHAKGARIHAGRDYVALKFNGNFPENPAARGLPTIQGAILLADGETGALLAIIDSTEVTLRRTAAASALAARLLARQESATLLVCGCGEQGRAHVRATAGVLELQRCLLWDAKPSAAEQLARDVAGSVGFPVSPASDLASAARQSDMIVTCTTAREPFLDSDLVKPGTFIAAVGADNPDKCELAPGLFARATVVVDVLRQCVEFGDLHHALRAGTIHPDEVHAELAEVLAGTKPGRRTPDETIIFDSTGTALEDVVAASAIYERCAGDPGIASIALASR